MHVTVDDCAKAPLGTNAAASRTTINNHALARSGGMMDRKNKTGKAKWAEAFKLWHFIP
jgi:hypothetical protein